MFATAYKLFTWRSRLTILNMTMDNGLTRPADVKLPGLGLDIDAHVKQFDPSFTNNER